MKITLTGSLGHISKPLATELVQEGHEVTVISSKADKQKEIEALGARAAIGAIEDVKFLATAFEGADAVYTMVPPANYFDPHLDLTAFVHGVGHSYADAIKQAGVKRVVHLSSVGAHLAAGTGIITAYHEVEKIMSQLADVAITFMRPTSFYYNLLSFIPAIKHMDAIAANYAGDDKIVWVSPLDIATAIADEIVAPLTGMKYSENKKVRYVASEELTCNVVASIIGTAISKPDLKWNLISQDQVQGHLEGIGMNKDVAAGLAEMQQNMHTGAFFEDYYKHKPQLGKTKMTTFAKEFAAAYNQQEQKAGH